MSKFCFYDVTSAVPCKYSGYNPWLLLVIVLVILSCSSLGLDCWLALGRQSRVKASIETVKC